MLREHLRGRFRLLLHIEDDLVQQTLIDLDRFLASRTEPVPDDELRAVGYTIFTRRIADTFRAEAREKALWSLTADSLEERQSPSAETVVRYRRMLVSVLRRIGAMAPEDQTLLLREVMPGSESGPQSPNDRKRLSRLRKELAAAIEHEVGTSPKNYLGGASG
jgi:DNA-directed RNA polymerase specialized sigma24 family protein